MCAELRSRLYHLRIMKYSAIETKAEAAQVRAEPAWYCLRSQPKHERIAGVQLRMLKGVTVFCPLIRFKKKTRRGLIWVTEAMFPGYSGQSFD